MVEVSVVQARTLEQAGHRVQAGTLEPAGGIQAMTLELTKTEGCINSYLSFKDVAFCEIIRFS